MTVDNNHLVRVWDTATGRIAREIGDTKTEFRGIALSPDGQTLIVANADANTVAVVDVSNSMRSFVNGFIPTGWYPTGAIFSRDGKQVFILSGKGLVPAANPANTSGRELLEVLSAPATVGPSRATMPNSAAPPRQERRTHLSALFSLTAYSPRRGLSQVPLGPGFDDPDAESLPAMSPYRVLRR